ncbi:hypothetical protein AB0H03_39345 [Streptomyces sparsogenes]|uniref:hypothetical protein n=1 Tax=Streptomyces sparsogenes TaxID=67365 RepID=UPI0033F20A60
MSSGQADFTLDAVLPDVSFPQPPAVADPFRTTVPSGVQDGVRGTGVSDHVGDTISDNIGGHIPGHIPGNVGQHLGEAVHNATGHALDAAMDQLHDMVVPALIGLGSLSGAVLVGRAAMAGAQVLAAAAIRAAEAQAELRQRQLEASRAAACWRDVAFAAVRANARIEALGARIRRAAAAAGPDGPPDPPDLPPPLTLVGLDLEEAWRRLADTDRRLRGAEAAYARATMAAVGSSAPGTYPAASGWHTKLRARRRRALEEYEAAASEAEARASTSPPPRAAPSVAGAAAPTEDEVLRQGADLLAMLPRNVSVADYRLVEEKVTVAAEVATRRPAAAKRHLREAARFAERLTREAERRQETEEWAAQRLAFLRDVPPGAPVPLPDATAETAILRRCLDDGRPPEAPERDRVEARVGERVDAYQRAYAAEVIRAAVRRSDPGTATRAARSSASATDQVIEWTPPGWGDDHWLRVTVDAHGTARVATMHRDRDPAEETDADRELDWRRCVEAPDHLRELRRLAERAGLALPFTFDEPPGRPAPRTAARTAHDHRPARKARHRDRDQEQHR